MCDFSENIFGGFLAGGIVEYIGGQQIARPIYGIEKGIRWVTE